MCVLGVGVICCRVERSKEEGVVPPGTNVLYIMIIGVLPNYRGRGIGRQMLEKVLAVCAEDKAKANPTKVYLHVRTRAQARLRGATILLAAVRVACVYARRNASPRLTRPLALFLSLFLSLSRHSSL